MAAEATTFKQAVEYLGIADYGERIFNSSSHGELWHLGDYIVIANTINDPTWFREWFEIIVKDAEANWDRPESIFQHIMTYMSQVREP